MGYGLSARRMVRAMVAVALVASALASTRVLAVGGNFSGGNSGSSNQNIIANCSFFNTNGLKPQSAQMALNISPSNVGTGSVKFSVPGVGSIALDIKNLSPTGGSFTGPNDLSGTINVFNFSVSGDAQQVSVQFSGNCYTNASFQADYQGLLTVTHNLVNAHTSAVLTAAFQDFTRTQVNALNFNAGDLLLGVAFGLTASEGASPGGPSGPSGPSGPDGPSPGGLSSVGDDMQLLPIAHGLRLQGQSAGDGFAYPWSLWVSYQHTDFSDDFTATAFDANSDTVLVGADFSPWENTLAGVAFGYDTTNMDTTFNGGGADLDSFSVVPYLAMSISDKVGVDYDLSFDLKAGFSFIDINQSRLAIGGARVTSDTNSDRVFFAANVNAGKNFGNWRLDGHTGWLVARDDRDAFTESDGTTVRRGVTQLGQLNVGGDVSYLWGTFEPFGSATYQLDYEREDFVTAPGTKQPANDDDEVLVGAGLRWFSQSGITAAFEWNGVFNRENFDADTYMFTIRGDF